MPRARPTSRATRPARKAGWCRRSRSGEVHHSPTPTISSAVAVELARLSGLRLRAIEELAEARLALGRNGALIELLRDAIDEFPHHETFAEQLMLARYRSGQQADALRTFSELQDRLGEIGLRPSARLRARSTDDVLLRKPHLELSRATDQPRAVMARTSPHARPSAAGRSSATSSTHTTVRGRASRGFVLVSGPAGIGKTTLAAEFIERARCLGASVLEAACRVDDGGGYEALGEMIGAMTTELGDSESELLRLFKSTRTDGASDAGDGVLETEQLRLFEAMASAIRDLGAQPVVLLVEDLHWAGIGDAACAAPPPAFRRARQLAGGRDRSRRGPRRRACGADHAVLRRRLGRDGCHSSGSTSTRPARWSARWSVPAARSSMSPRTSGMPHSATPSSSTHCSATSPRNRRGRVAARDRASRRGAERYARALSTDASSVSRASARVLERARCSAAKLPGAARRVVGDAASSRAGMIDELLGARLAGGDRRVRRSLHVPPRTGPQCGVSRHPARRAGLALAPVGRHRAIEHLPPTVRHGPFRSRITTSWPAGRYHPAKPRNLGRTGGSRGGARV